MDTKITYNAEVWPLVLTPLVVNEIFTKGRKLFHWIYKDEREFVETVFDPNFQFFGLVNKDKFLGLCWIYDLKEGSAKCGTLIWERINNFEELIQRCFFVFDLIELRAEVSKENNILSKRLLNRLGFTKQFNGIWIRRK